MTIFEHHKWEPNGRTRIELDEGVPTGRYKYTSKIGERQTPDGIGGFVPFLRDINTITHGDLNFELATDKQIIRKAGQILCGSFKFFVQAYIGGEWVNQPHGVPDRNFREGEIFRDGGWVEDDGKCTGFLSFPDASLSFGPQNSYDLYIALEAGRESRARMGVRFCAPVSGQVRFVAVLDELQKLPTDWEWIWARYAPEKEKEDRKIGIRVKDFEWKWTYDEAPYRSIVAEDNLDGTKKISVIFGEYSYTENEWLTIYPDQWGETGISETGDDCEQIDGAGGVVDLSGRDSDGLTTGFFTGAVYDTGFRFQNVVIAGNPTSIDAGTQIEFDVTYEFKAEFQSSLRFYGLEGDIGIWENTTPHGPEDEVKTAAFVAIDGAIYQDATGNDKVIDGADFQALIKEILDTSWSSGYDLGLEYQHDLIDTSGFIQIEDYETIGGGTAAARLTIVYTPAAGTTTPPTTLPPTTLAPTTPAPTTPSPTTTPPTTSPPTTSPPTTLAPTTLPPTTAPPTTPPPTTIAPTTAAPPTLAPTTLPPTTLAPTTLSPTTPPPTTAPPTTLPPTTPAPTTPAPTTLPPTTAAPTTLAPTTAPPTTSPPTTVAPTTSPPTTPVPTTVAPPTKVPTTIPPTTLAPTTIQPTTLSPTTLIPTTAPPAPDVRRRGWPRNFGFSMRTDWRT